MTAFAWCRSALAMIACGLVFVEPARGSAPAPTSSRLVLASYALGAGQARKARVLARSIRAFGGPYRDARVFIVVDEAARAELTSTPNLPGTLVDLDLPEAARGVPFAAKAYAAAQVERAVAQNADTLLWMDPESVLLAPPEPLVLRTGAVVALQPVFLLNRVGFGPGEPVPPYWERIYREAGVEAAAVPTVRAVVDDSPIRFYVNCGVIAYRPSRGLCREWARVLTALLADADYRRLAAADPLQTLFLHQAALSAVICARTGAAERQWIPVTGGYPLNLHARVPAARRVARLNDVVCLIYDTVWDQQPDWMSKVTIAEPLATWLREAYRSTLETASRTSAATGRPPRRSAGAPTGSPLG